MLSLLTSPLTKGLLIITILASSIAAITTHLYLSTRDNLASLESQYTQLKQDFKDCSDSKERVKLSAEQDDRIIAYNQSSLYTIRQENDSLKLQLNKIPKVKCKQYNTEVSNEVPYVDIDLPFSPEFTRVLKQLDNKTSGSSNPSP